MNKKTIQFIITTFLGIFFIILFLPTLASAEAKWAIPNPRIPIPGTENIKDMAPVCSAPDANGRTECAMPWLNTYIAGIYKYAIGVVAILATVVMMIGGLVWLTSAGDSGRIGTAKQYISGALTGLVLVFSSYTILYFVNPDLVKLKPITIQKIEKVEPPPKAGCIWSVRSGSAAKCESGFEYSSRREDCLNPDQRNGYICCCPVVVPSEIEYGECSECITLIGVPCKDGNQVTRVLGLKIKSAYSSRTIDWQVTEAWPPTVNHLSECHKIGTCADINLTSRSTDPNSVLKAYNDLNKAGIDATYEHGSDCTNYTSIGIKCMVNPGIVPHFHVK